MKRFYCIILTTQLLLSGSYLQAQEYFPDDINWERKEASSNGFNTSRLINAVEFAKSNEYSGSRDLKIAILAGFSREPYHEILGPTKDRGGPAGLIIKNGYIVAEWGDIERVDMTFSVTKSYLSTVAGLAWQEGKIEGFHDPVAKYVWDGTFDGSHNANITWHHLLNQSSDWSGSLFGLHDWADRPPREGDVNSWSRRELHEPGTYFKYNDVRVNVLSYSLLQVWRKPLPVILKEKIMDPIGASDSWRWFGYDHSWVTMDGMKVQSVSGGGHSGGGVFINTVDHARFGLLFSRNGNWKGKQLLDSEWIAKAITSSEANESYGYMWWLNQGNRSWEEVPEHVFYAAGFGGNYIVVDQENDLVVVTRWLEPSKAGEFMRLVYASLK